jgi:signal peptidase I
MEGEKKEFRHIASSVEKFFQSKWFYAAVAALFLLFLFTKSVLLEFAIAILIVLAVVFEFIGGVKEGGLKSELKNTAIAIGVALVVWFGSGFILQTPGPINAVVSCSMLPNLERGDMVLLAGWTVDAQEMQMPQSEFDKISNDARVVYDGGELGVLGSMLAYCSNEISKSGMGANQYCNQKADDICCQFLREPEGFAEYNGPLKFQYKSCGLKYLGGGQTAQGPCVESVEYAGKVISQYSQDTIVFESPKDQLYSRTGDIIHRAFVAIKTDEGKIYYLSKGDNNPVFDMQTYSYSLEMGNGPVAKEQLKGKVILRIPLLGYFKIFITPQLWGTPEGCDSIYAKYA